MAGIINEFNDAIIAMLFIPSLAGGLDDIIEKVGSPRFLICSVLSPHSQQCGRYGFVVPVVTGPGLEDSLFSGLHERF
jgi:hypothetical protein